MARTAVAALALLALALCTAPARATDSTGWQVEGFTIVSNVTGYLYMARDACDINALAMAPPPVNFTAIRNIFDNGRYSFRPNGIALRWLTAWGTGSHATAHPWFTNGTALFNNSNWINGFIDVALDTTNSLTSPQRSWMAIHSGSLILPLNYMLAELNGLFEEIDPNGTNVTAEGAPHILDEGFGAYHGNVSDCAPWAYMEEAAEYFGTLNAACTRSQVNDAVIAGFNQAQAATLNGNLTQYAQAVDVMVTAVQVGLVQNVILRAHQVEEAWKAVARAEAAAQDANDAFLHMPDAAHFAAAAQAAAALANATMRLGAAKADSYSVSRALTPFAHVAHPIAAQAVNHYLALDTPVARGYAAQVQLALQALYPAMGITAEMVGTYGASSGCPAKRM